MTSEGRSARSRHTAPGAPAPGAREAVADVARQPGQPLETSARHRMEAGFGQDFSNVRIHTGPLAAESANSIAAAAYTTGHHIVFGAGAYTPGTEGGAHTLAHELAHVVQQRASATRGPQRQPADIGAAHDAWEQAADAAAHAVMSAGGLHAPALLARGGTAAAPAIQRQPAPDPPSPDPKTPDPPTQVLEIPLIPPEWLRQPGRNDLLLARLGGQMVALPAQGAFTMLQPPTIPTPAPAAPTTVLVVPTVAKESVKMVSAGGTAAFLIDAGGEPLVVTPAAMAAMSQTLGARSLAGIVVTHLHEDHVRSLFDIVIANGVKPENLRFPEAFLTNIAAPSSLFARLVRDLGNDPRGQQLGYGPNARFGSIPTPTQGNWWRTEIVAGDMVIEAYGLTAAFRELEARRARGEEQKAATLPGGVRTQQLSDTASLLLRYTHKPTGFRSVFVSDERYTDLELLKTAMGRPAYAEIFQGVRVVEGVGHHMGAIETTAEQTAFGTFLKDIQMGGGGRVAIMAQSQETRSGRQFLNRSAIAAINEAGIDVHVALEPRGAAVGVFSVNSEGQVTYSGAGRAQSFLSNSPINAEIRRLDNLRAIEKILTQYEQYAEPAHRRSAEFKQARERLEAELNAFFDTTASNVRTGARGRAQGSVRDPALQATALARVQGAVAPVETLVTPGYMAGIAELSRVGNFAEIFRQEVESARSSGRMSDRGIDALWNLDPAAARKLLSSSGLARSEQRRVAASLPGAPSPVPVRLVAGALLAIQVAELAAPIAASIRASRFNDHVKPALEALMWWQRAGVFPEMEAVDDNLWPFSNEWTTKPDRIQELLNDNEISYLTLTSIPEVNWDRFTIWASARLKNQLDWAQYFSGNPAIRIASGDFMGEHKFEYYTSVVHGDTIGFTLTETWQHSDRLDLILNAAALAVVARSNTEIARAGQAEGAGLHGSIKSMDDHSSPLFDTMPQATGRWRFAQGVEPVLYTTFMKRPRTGYAAAAVFYSFPARPHQDVPDDFVVVGGADYNTFSAIVGTRNDFKISNVDGYGGWRVGNLLPNTEQVLLARKSDLVAVP
ncbi:MAG: DUF4157 domain-containing protein [Specibacter sp.]